MSSRPLSPRQPPNSVNPTYLPPFFTPYYIYSTFLTCLHDDDSTSDLNLYILKIPHHCHHHFSPHPLLDPLPPWSPPYQCQVGQYQKPKIHPHQYPSILGQVTRVDSYNIQKGSSSHIPHCSVPLHHKVQQ